MMQEDVIFPLFQRVLVAAVLTIFQPVVYMSHLSSLWMVGKKSNKTTSLALVVTSICQLT